MVALSVEDGLAALGTALMIGAPEVVVLHGSGDVDGRLRALERRKVAKASDIDGGKGALGVTHFQPEVTQHAESLRAGDFMNEMTIDINGILSALYFFYDMGIPDLVK